MAVVLVPDWTSRQPLGHGYATGTPRQKVLFTHELSPDSHSEAIPGRIFAVFKLKATVTPRLLLGAPHLQRSFPYRISSAVAPGGGSLWDLSMPSARRARPTSHLFHGS